MPVPVIVMGVSGCGKSSLGQALAAHWQIQFVEGDGLHAPESVAKMSAGIPLTDADRWPWLDRIADALSQDAIGHGGVIASCSALRRVYRDHLRSAVGPHLRFLMIELPRHVLEQRMVRRTGHYMPPGLLDSQLRTLEHPAGEDDVLILDGTAPMADLVATADLWCRASSATFSRTTGAPAKSTWE